MSETQYVVISKRHFHSFELGQVVTKLGDGHYTNGKETQYLEDDMVTLLVPIPKADDLAVLRRAEIGDVLITDDGAAWTITELDLDCPLGKPVKLRQVGGDCSLWFNWRENVKDNNPKLFRAVV